MGDAAANIAVSACLECLANTRGNPTLGVVLVDLFKHMDDAVRASLNGRGTTTASVVLGTSSGLLVAANVGDSRIFSWNKETHSVRQVSVDDTIENELKRFVSRDSSMLDARGIRGSLSQALGEPGRSSEELRVTLLRKDEFQPGGIFVATDGAWKANEEAFNQILCNAASGFDAVKRVLTFAVWAGGGDNASAVAIEDIASFTKRPDSTPARGGLTAWFAESKVVAIDITHESRPVIAPVTPTETAKQSKKGKGGGRRRGKLKSPQANQLTLQDSPNETEQSAQTGRRRPQIEISTDDDTAKE
jgi:hypothetical protein